MHIVMCILVFILSVYSVVYIVNVFIKVYFII